MKLICAWCGATIERPGYSQQKPDTSHGLCPVCFEAFRCQERGASLQQHLDTIPIPVLLIDDSNAVVTMNAKARDTLGKRPEDTRVQLFGKVFDCIYSHNSEGCGRKIHCAGCAIRKSVTTTFHTGKPQVSVPATLSVTSPDDISEAVLNVTTVKVGELVLLRID